MAVKRFLLRLGEWFGWLNEYEITEDSHCPVCGYYCRGQGGWGCIDKPAVLKERKAVESNRKGW